MYSYMYWWQFPGLNCQKCLLRPQVTERRCPLNGGCQVTLLWTIMGNMFRECHGPCTLKTSFVDFRKEYWYMLIISTAKSKFLRLPKSPFFSSDSQRSFPWFSLPSLISLYFFYIYCWTCSYPKYAWNFCHLILRNH